MGRKKNEATGISLDSAVAYASCNDEQRQRILEHALDLSKNLGDDFARRHLEISQICWEEFEAYCKAHGGNDQQRESPSNASFADRLDTAIDEIIDSTRIQNALGIFVVAELEGKPDALLLSKKNVGKTTIDALNRALREKLAIERTPDGRLHDCNGERPEVSEEPAA